MYRWVRSTYGLMMVIVVFLPLMANDVNTGGQKGIVRSISAYTLGKSGLNFGGSFRLATEMRYVSGYGGEGSVYRTGSRVAVSRTNPFLMTGDVYCAYGILSYLDAAIDLPVYSDISGWGANKFGFGDIALSLKMAYPFQEKAAFFVHSYYLRLMFPTGAANTGYFPRHSYFLSGTTGINVFTSDAFLFNPMMVWTLDVKKLAENIPIQMHVNFGGIIAKKKRNSVLLAALGIEYTPLPDLTLFTEIAGESRVDYYSEVFDASAINNDPLWISPGLKVNLPSGIYATLAGDFGISDNDKAFYANWKRNGYQYSTKATPAYGFHFSVGWNGLLVKPDSDNDGLLDEVDKCPMELEDRDGFQDDDGCPDIDNDNDGFLDVKDRCPDSAGTDGGCPVYDTDKDGIDDIVDKCPSEAEDKDGFQDNDGCPDTDNDADGVVDQKDNCPDIAEDIDGYDDGDGCPDFDNDGDGVSDPEDKCPGVRGLPSNNGCPKSKEITRGKLILSGVTFQPGKATLTSNSYTILDQVYESLTEWPEVKLEIQGHTDNLGDDEANLRLSQMRADEVKKYFVNKGVENSRLRAVGYGEEFPIADNHSAEGRERNRRVELRRID